MTRAALRSAGETYVRLNVRNNDFKTVMAAIGRWDARRGGMKPSGWQASVQQKQCWCPGIEVAGGMAVGAVTGTKHVWQELICGPA